MEIVEQGFRVIYELVNMGRPMAGGSGDYNGRPYNASVKVRCTQVSKNEDEVLGDVFREEIVEFRVICDTNSESSDLNKLFQNLRNNGVVVTLNGSTAVRENGILKITVFDTAKSLIQKYHKDMKKTDTKAS